MSRRLSAALVAGTGAALGWIAPLPLDAPDPGVSDAPAAPTREPAAEATPDPAAEPVALRTTPSGEPTEDLPDLDCAPERLLRGRVDALASDLEEARSHFTHRYGEPIPAPEDFDPVDAEARVGDLLEGYPGRRWSTVDCTVPPCVGLLLTDAHAHPSDIAKRLGLPHARVTTQTLSGPDDEPLNIVTIGFVDRPLQAARSRWVGSRAARIFQEHLFTLDAIYDGHERAE